MIGSRPSPQREHVLALTGARVLDPNTKLATARRWHTSTLAEEFCVHDADANDLYAAMDWPLERQPAIERKLAARHLEESCIALYDLPSSYFQGYPNARWARSAKNRDGKKNKLQVNYELMTTRHGFPIVRHSCDG